MIKVDLVTGFLGSGKTTFLLKYARFLMDQGLRIGILEYDYGAVNVDMLLLNQLRGPKCELEMLAAACDTDCLKRRFKTKLIAMAMSGYDRVIIEPSGIFDMDMFFDDLREEPLENWYEIGSVITIVNANLEENFSESEDFVLASQAAGAGLIVFSRTQLSDPAHIDAAKAHLKRAAEKIHCQKLCTSYLEKDWDTLDAADFVRVANAGFHVNDYVKLGMGEEMDFSSVCLLKIPYDLATLKDKIRTLFSDPSYGNVTRVKGFLVDGGVSHEINATKGELTDKPIAIGQEVVIVIGSRLDEKKIRTFLEQ